MPSACLPRAHCPALQPADSCSPQRTVHCPLLGQGLRQSATCLEPDALMHRLPHRERPIGNISSHVHTRERRISAAERGLLSGRLTGDKASTLRTSRLFVDVASRQTNRVGLGGAPTLELVKSARPASVSTAIPSNDSLPRCQECQHQLP